MQGSSVADIGGMSRTVGLPLLLVALAVGGYLFVQQGKTNGPAAAVITQAETQAQSYAAATNFQAAVQVLQASFAANGTYAGSALPAGSGVALVRADASSFCLQTTDTAAAVMHETGPNGTLAAGPC
jgi:hypothetical protein